MGKEAGALMRRLVTRIVKIHCSLEACSHPDEAVSHSAYACSTSYCSEVPRLGYATRYSSEVLLD